MLAVMPTGAGKTVLVAKIVHDEPGPSCTIAHRQELVSQISIALARNGIRHRIIAPNTVVRSIVRMHMAELGASFYNPSAKAGVAGVDTLVRRTGRYAQWMQSVKLWIQDEAHHVLKKNKWGKAADAFPNARGLGVTATPVRADGAGLGRHHDGLFDEMIVGPSMRWLIDSGYLTEYRIFAPLNTLDLSQVSISKTTGDFNQNDVRDVVAGSSLVVSDDKATVTGDIVSHYLKHASGKLGVTFVPSVDVADTITAQYIAAGIPAATVSAKTSAEDRAELLNRFKRRELLQLVNVDLFGEGFDLPAIEVVSMARPTASYSLYVQQFGRALRLLEGKEFAIVIDHVGNVARHGLPDSDREWSLDRREKRSGGAADDIPPVKTCNGKVYDIPCQFTYPRYKKACPLCGHVNVPALRSGPEFVDGDLMELDAETLAQLRGAADAVNDDNFNDDVNTYRLAQAASGIPGNWQFSNVQKFATKLKDQYASIDALKECMAWWAGHHRHNGRDNAAIFRTFYLTFGLDWLSAQALQANDADALSERVMRNTGKR